MSKLEWDLTGEKLYETGVEQVALYVVDNKGEYGTGVAWNGITALNLSPSGAEPTNLYANNKKYLTLTSLEELGYTVEAYTYPPEWAACDGSAAVAAGVYVGQQPRKTFGLVAKTLIGNDVVGTKYGYKLHLLYGSKASVSEKSNATISDSPEANTMSWECTTTPVAIPGFEPSSYICIDSTEVDAENLAALEAILYGSDDKEASLPLPEEVFTTLGVTQQTT